MLVRRHPALRAVVETESAISEVVAECLEQHDNAHCPNKDNIGDFKFLLHKKVTY